jgi:indolepyruvate ferredoxin oxidoreductase beta subunit
MKESYDIIIAGIGGQGTILASNIIGEACIIEGRTIRGAETHGMAQRGGSVECQVRIDGRHGPLIAPGQADLLIAFDLLEALRYSHFLREGGIAIVNDHLVPPTSVFLQNLPMPTAAEIPGMLRARGIRVTLLDAAAIATEAGSVLTQNVVILGAASHHLPLTVESLSSAVERSVPAKTVVINQKAFLLGRDAAGGC